MISIGYKIKEIRKQLNIKQIDFAKKLDIAETTLRNYEKDKFPINHDLIYKITNVFNVNLDWLLLNEGSMFRSGNILPTSNDNKYLIPKLSFDASAGGGSIINNENIVDYLAVDKTWLNNFFGITHNNIYIIQVNGESMFPTFNSGDLLLFDISIDYYKNDGIYIIRIDDTIMVKRIQYTLKTIEILSDNKNYKSFSIEKTDFDNSNCKILGKVIASFNRL